MNRHERGTMSLLKRWGLVLVVSALGAGCAGSVTPGGEGEYGIRAERLPNLPGCDARANEAHGKLTARPIIGGDGLVLVYSDGQPHCVDTLEGAARHLAGFVVLLSGPPVPSIGWGSSDPMPGTDPSDPSKSDPMPGKGGSDPMPGRQH